MNLVEEKNVLRIAAVDAASLSNELQDRMIGMEVEKGFLGAKEPGGEVHFYAPQGADANFNSVTVDKTTPTNNNELTSKLYVDFKTSAATATPISSGVIPVGTGTGIEDSDITTSGGMIFDTATTEGKMLTENLRVVANFGDILPLRPKGNENTLNVAGAHGEGWKDTTFNIYENEIYNGDSAARLNINGDSVAILGAANAVICHNDGSVEAYGSEVLITAGANHFNIKPTGVESDLRIAHEPAVELNESVVLSQMLGGIETVKSKGASGAVNVSQGNGSWKEFVGLSHKNYGSGIDVLEFSTVPGSSNDKDKRIAFTKTLVGVNNNSYLNQSTLSFEELPATETNSQQYRSGYNIYNSFVEQISYTNSNNYTTRNISVTPEILMFNRSVTIDGNPTPYNNQIRLTSQGYLSCENSYEDMYNPGNDPKIILNREMLGMTSSGDLIVGSTDGIPNRIAKGAIGTVLTVKNDGTVGWNNSSVLTKKQVTITYSTDSAIYSNEIVTPVSGEGNWSVLKMGHPIPDGYKVIKASALLASFSTNSIAEVSFELRRLPMDGSTGGLLSGNSGTLQSTFKIENIPNTSGATKYYKGQCTTLSDTVADNSMLFCRVLNQSLTEGTGVIINIVLEEV